MKSRNASISLVIIVLLLIVFFFRVWREPSLKEAFDRYPSHLYYTQHALCRMDCRHISRADIKEIMQKGIINFSKSDRNDRPCPTFALQGRTTDGESLRVVFAQCDQETKVITCYNLEQEFDCSCPGDEKKKH
jgi:hypothetical protein